MRTKSLQSCPTLCDPARLLCPWDSPGKHTGLSRAHPRALNPGDALAHRRRVSAPGAAGSEGPAGALPGAAPLPGRGSGSSGPAPSLPHNEPDDPEKSDRSTAIINPPPEASQFRKKKRKKTKTKTECLNMTYLAWPFIGIWHDWSIYSK